MIKPIELRGITEQSTVAPPPHICNDAPDGGQHRIESGAAALLKRSEQSSGFAGTPSFRSNQLHRSSLVPSSLQHDFVQRVFDDACCACGLKFRNDISSNALFDNRVNGNPI
jgi:hypothetical protein